MSSLVCKHACLERGHDGLERGHVAMSMLLTAAILSVFKPWGRIGGRRTTPSDVVQQPLRDGRAVRVSSGV